MITIRPAVRSDARAIGRLAAEFHDYLRSLGDSTTFKFGPTEYLQDGFGEKAAFDGLVAEVDGIVTGYTLYHDGYETDQGRRVIHIIDLYVQEASRRLGIGRALMRHLTEVGRQRGAKVMIWSVYEPNGLAVCFYEQLGAKYIGELRWMSLHI